MTRRHIVILAILSVLAVAMGLDLYLLKGHFWVEFNEGFTVRVMERQVVPNLR